MISADVVLSFVNVLIKVYDGVTHIYSYYIIPVTTVTMKHPCTNTGTDHVYKSRQASQYDACDRTHSRPHTRKFVDACDKSHTWMSICLHK